MSWSSMTCSLRRLTSAESGAGAAAAPASAAAPAAAAPLSTGSGLGVGALSARHDRALASEGRSHGPVASFPAWGEARGPLSRRG